jgi:hypothetical protein
MRPRPCRHDRVAEALERADAAYLVADWTRRDAAIAVELARHGRSGVPLYLVYPADGGEPEVLPQLLTEGQTGEASGLAGSATTQPDVSAAARPSPRQPPGGRRFATITAILSFSR